jgi:hypothetical protein
VASYAFGNKSAQGTTCPVQEFIGAFNARDLIAMMALLSEDCTYHNLAYPQPYQGKPVRCSA